MTRARSANRRRIEQLAARLVPLLNRVVFAGESALDFLLIRPGLAGLHRPVGVNPTVSVVAYGSPDRLAHELRQLGFTADGVRSPHERWRSPDGTSLDLIAPEGWAPVENPWYAYVLECTLQIHEETEPGFRTIGAPAFLATQLFDWHATAGAGASIEASGIWEDVVLLAISRPAIVREIAAAPPDVRAHLSLSLQPLVAGTEPLASVSALLPRAARTPLAAQRALDALCRIAGVLHVETALVAAAYNSGPGSPNQTS